MTGTLLVNNCGLGDMLIATGLIRHLVVKPGVPLPLTVLCKEEYEAEANHLWGDLVTASLVRIHCLRGQWIYTQAKQLKGEDWGRVIDVSGFSGANPDWGKGEPFDVSMYRLAGVPHREKWDSFMVERHPHEFAGPEGVIVIHDDTNREFRIDYRRVPQGERVHVLSLNAPTIFHLRHILETAAEIHCIDSSIANFVDLLEIDRPRFLHAYARTTEFMPQFGEGWEVLD